MNRRVIYDPQHHDSAGRRIASAIVTFVFVLAVCALLSIDDVETEPRRVAPEFQP